VLFQRVYSLPSGDSCSVRRCLSSWLLVLKGFPHIWQASLPGSKPRMGSPCKGGALGRIDRVLTFLRSTIKTALHDKEKVTVSLIV
jgi:hypothetical protein